MLYESDGWPYLNFMTYVPSRGVRIQRRETPLFYGALGITSNDQYICT
jgi:hypothetical protein